MYDTVVFDISQSTMAGNQVSFPVYIITDDTVNALDFSLLFDETNFSLDTIINLTAYLQPTYNMVMNTLYFTSYSLQEIDHHIPLISIRLNMLGHYLCSDDLDSVLGYLNGEPCSVKIVECVSDNIAEQGADADLVSVYPNPSAGVLNVETPENATVQLLGMNGASVLFQAPAEANRPLKINTTGFVPGIYIMKIVSERNVTVKKVAVR